MLTYAARAWAKHINVYRVRALRGAQRHALLRIVHTYGKISNAGLQVLLDIRPINIELELGSMYYNMRHIYV